MVMIQTNVGMSREDLFREVVSRGRHQGVTTQEAYNDLAEAVVEEARADGKLHADNPTEEMTEHLQQRWSDYVRELGLDTEAPVL